MNNAAPAGQTEAPWPSVWGQRLNGFASTERLVVVMLAGVPLVRFLTDWARGLDFLLYQYLVDDAFYYFEIARHIPEFNLGVPTSGFHPLYAFLISPLHVYLRYELAIPLSLLLLVCAYAASTLLLYQLLSGIWDEPIPLLAAAAWALNGKLYSIALSGVETMLAIFLVLCFLRHFVRRGGAPHGRWQPVHYTALGALAGLAFLARMDVPLILFPFLAHVGVSLLLRRQFTRLAALIIPALLPPLVWMAHIKMLTGSAFPTSGAALRVLRGIDGTLLAPLSLASSALKQLIRHTVAFFAPVASATLPLLASGLVLLGAVLLISRIPRDRMSRAAYPWPLLGGILLWCAYYVLYQGGFRTWYFAYVGLGIFAVFLPLLLALVFHKVTGKRSAFVASVVIILVMSILSAPGPVAPQELDKYRAALVANEVLEDADTEGAIGAFNTGIYDYFMEVDVLNLDGVVNPDSLRALRGGTMAQYVRGTDIRYLIEHDPDEAANAYHLFEDPQMCVEKWLDLSAIYDPEGKVTVKRTYLWRVYVDRAVTTDTCYGR